MLTAICDQILVGEGLTAVVKGLNSKGIAGLKGKGWCKTGLRKMLANETYIGTMVWGRQSKRNLPAIKMENAFPAILTPEVFRQANSMLGGRSFEKVHPRRVASQYLLSGIARCGHCGKALVGLEAKSGQFSYYVCGSLAKKGSGACPAKYQNTRKLESLIVVEIRERILVTENLAELAAEVTREMSTSTEAYRGEMEAVDAEMSNATRRLERLYDLIETGKLIPDDIGPRVRELKEKREKLMSRKTDLELLVAQHSVEPPTPREIRECVGQLLGGPGAWIPD